MGTRNLTIVYFNGEYKVAQYCQWDGYLTGQGQTVLDFLKQRNLEKFKEQLNKIEYPNAEQIKQWWVNAGASPDTDWVNFKIVENFKEKHAQLYRDMGADVLDYIYNTNTPLLRLDLEFAADSLFCEFAYVIDLDKNCLEIYKGFNKKPLSEKERFYFLNNKSDSNYFPIKLWKCFTFDELKNLNTLADEDTDDE